MNILTRRAMLPVALLFTTVCAHAADAPTPPSEWIDPATGHVVVRLSKEPGTASLYFHQNPYTPDGKKLLVVTPEGMATIDLKTHAIDTVVPGYPALAMSRSSGIEVSRKSNTVYYTSRANGQSQILATNLDTKETRTVATLPPGLGEFGGLNADETMLIGSYRVPAATPTAPATPDTATSTATTAIPVTAASTPATPTPTPVETPSPAPANRGGRRDGAGGGGGAGGGPALMQFFSVNIKTGEVNRFFEPGPFNLNHVQSSPTDPHLFLYAHEGDWTQVDRVWTLHNDGTGSKLMHVRSMPYEIAGHEFFSHDGQWVYYDLQTPESGEFWIGRANLATGEHDRFPLERGQWSVHYNVSWDGKVFSGDGGGPNSVANRTPPPNPRKFDPPQNGQWMYLFTPTGEFTAMKVNGEDVKVGKLTAEKLADLSKHNYGNGESSRVEPNATFTPDDKWLVFRSNMEGPTHVYEVEIAKATPEETKRIEDEWAAYRAAVAAMPTEGPKTP